MQLFEASKKDWRAALAVVNILDERKKERAESAKVADLTRQVEALRAE